MRFKRSLSFAAVIGALTILIAWWLGRERSSEERSAADAAATQVLGTSGEAPAASAPMQPESRRLTAASPLEASSPTPSSVVGSHPGPAPATPTAVGDTGPTGASPPSAGPIDGGTRYKLDRDGLREAMRSGLPEIKDCYEQWLRLQPDLGGRLRVQFTIDTDDGVEGRVTTVSLGDAGMGHLAMEGCVLSVVSGLHFEPPLNGSINVTYPLAFAASDGGSAAAPQPK